MTLTLYTNPQSRGITAQWMLDEVGADYETQILSYGAEMRTPEFLSLNPMGKVPTLVHDGAVITEVAAICTYLAEVFPDAGLAPTPEERAAYLRMFFFAAATLEPAMTLKNAGFETTEEQAVSFGFGTLERALNALEQMLEGRDYVTGRFTAADVYLGGKLNFALAFGLIPARPVFEHYRDKQMERPAIQKIMAALEA